MNANELADWITKTYVVMKQGKEYEIATMLRQQHAEIEALKAEATNTVMAEHCTCYKLGYSPLNDYALVKQK